VAQLEEFTVEQARQKNVICQPEAMLDSAPSAEPRSGHARARFMAATSQIAERICEPARLRVGGPQGELVASIVLVARTLHGI
jgi:hypothetical protein